MAVQEKWWPMIISAKKKKKKIIHMINNKMFTFNFNWNDM